MKFSLETVSNRNYIQTYSSDFIVVKLNDNLESFELITNFILSPCRIIFDKLTGSGRNFDDGNLFILKSLGVEILIFETRFSDRPILPKLEFALSSGAMGIEYMVLGSACRTYNLLVTEGRLVALIVNFL
ncbi:MAG: hypothetical protein HRT91_02420 [Piscirickettsiaceae bacterium]|nr:hypothetical protein [Piscirickettsiaceae bacterium]